ATSKIRVRGVVSYHDPGEILFVTNGTETLRVLTRSRENIEPGTQVDVVGLIQREGRRVYLVNPVFRLVGQADEPEPIAIDFASSTLDPAFDGRSVSFAGRLIEIERLT